MRDLHKNTVQSPEEYFTPPTWPPFLCLLLQHGRRDVMLTHYRGVGHLTHLIDNWFKRVSNNT